MCVVKLFSSCVLARSGKGRRVNSTAQGIIYNVHKRENGKNKNRGPPKLTFKTAKATSYRERTTRRDVAEISGAAFTSATKRYKIDRKRIVQDDFDTEVL